MGVIRYHLGLARKRSHATLRKTYSDVIPTDGDNLNLRLILDLYAPDFKNIDFTTVVEGLAINDNIGYRVRGMYATEKTFQALDFS